VVGASFCFACTKADDRAADDAKPLTRRSTAYGAVSIYAGRRRQSPPMER
jgi:hypothetical protein